MASATENGELRIYAVSPEGQRILTHRYRNGGAISAGGSPDGVLANKTQDKWVFIPKADYPVLTGGWKVQLFIVLDASDGLDASDSYIEIPLTIRGGGIKYLNATDLGYTTDYPANSPAGVELPLGAGYTIPDGQEAKIGGDHGVISIEDDTI